jgi:hypothetical protein
MPSPKRTVHEPYVRVRVVRFSIGRNEQLLENIKLRVDTFDLQQGNSIFFVFLIFTILFSIKNSFNKSTEIP